MMNSSQVRVRQLVRRSTADIAINEQHVGTVVGSFQRTRAVSKLKFHDCNVVWTMYKLKYNVRYYNGSVRHGWGAPLPFERRGVACVSGASLSFRIG